MGLVTNERYEQMRDYVHPKMHSFTEHYRCGHRIDLPPYHGCNATNKNGTRKLIRYRRRNRRRMCFTNMEMLLEETI